MKESQFEDTVYLYDLFGNVIGEAWSDGTIKREWVYLGGQRLAMIVPVMHGGSLCSLAGKADGAAAFLGLMALVFIGLGLRYRNRKFTVAGLTFIGGVLVLILMPEARSQTPTEYIYFYHNDHLGTPRVLTDEQAAVVLDVDYKPFGEVSSYVTNTLGWGVNQPFRFPGQYADELSGVYYNWNRYYMPGVGRYTEVEPQGALQFNNLRRNFPARGLPCSRDLELAIFDLNYSPFIASYSYSNNNPIFYIDPSALDMFGWPGKTMVEQYCERRPDCKCASKWKWICKTKICYQATLFWITRQWGCEYVYWSWCAGEAPNGVPT